jgi:hypothetical protein
VFNFLNPYKSPFPTLFNFEKNKFFF